MYAGHGLRKKQARQTARSIIPRWLLHLSIFAIFQLLFILFDGSRMWIIFNLNDNGEKMVSLLRPLFDGIQFYASEQLNYVTVVWGIVVVVHGVVSLVEWMQNKK
ncbi:YfzA family protein [Kroppenstedtia eburnea]|uniref:YfzA family protein n=1 Tax=Kroppenstedtia eburnea TaxID=714067 RepID=UPI003641E310